MALPDLLAPLFAAAATFLPAPDDAPSLEQALAREGPESLARAARTRGDAARGAKLFYQAQLNCVRCHVAGPNGASLGPELARDSRNRPAAELVESVLNPSKVVREGYATVTVATHDGKTLTGVLAEEKPDALVVRDPAKDGARVVVRKADVEARRDGGPSVMPAGLTNLLGSRDEFLDLARYLIEVTEGGPSRALELRPSAADLVPPQLPAYESDLDHAGLLKGLDRESFRRGEAIYDRVCKNCHGTRDQPGSLPTSLRFATGAFKNGSDPYRMYQTITRGYGQMPPQTWMVPSQKYDVIHYIREAFLKPSNLTQYAEVTPAYLASLPKGALRGPRPDDGAPYLKTDHGASLMLTLEIGNNTAHPNIAYKGIAVRVDPGPGGVVKGSRWVIYDHDTMRIAGAWSGQGFIDWNGINFNGRHEIHPRTVGTVHMSHPVGPGWADPQTGSFDDPRLRGRDGRPYGPLPKSWAHYRGLYHHGDRVVVSYTVGDADILESPSAQDGPGGRPVFARTFQVGRSTRDLAVRVAPASNAAAVVNAGLRVEKDQGFQVVRVPAGKTPVAFKVLVSDGPTSELEQVARNGQPAEDLSAWTHGGPSRWADKLTTRIAAGPDDGPFAADTLTAPESNPWGCQFRLGGFDFFEGGRRAAVCTWDGDVWLVDGVDALNGPLTWRRFASGLFQPLGLRIVGGQIYVTCRDQIAAPRDLDGDGEADFVSCFNSDQQVTEHFHEFAMDLQTDADGNFYYTKAARHAKTALVPQHGTLLKVSRDGSTTEILARGFRAPNGVCLNTDGSFFVSDQEGHWTPKNRVNRVVKGGFYGNMWGYHDVTDPSDAAMEQPLCWITNAFDRSPAEPLWVTGDRWGPLKGSLLSMSYGYGKLYVVPYETVGGQVQGGMCELPVAPFPTGVMRGRFHPGNGQLYLCGLFSWAGNQTAPGGFYRVRATGKTFHVPLKLRATPRGVAVTFSAPLDRSAATDASRYAVRTWSLRRNANYGSPHLGEAPLPVASASLSADGRTVFLELPGVKPTWGMQIVYALKGAQGEAVEGRIHNTIHRLGSDDAASR